MTNYIGLAITHDLIEYSRNLFISNYTPNSESKKYFPAYTYFLLICSTFESIIETSYSAQYTDAKHLSTLLRELFFYFSSTLKDPQLINHINLIEKKLKLEQINKVKKHPNLLTNYLNAQSIDLKTLNENIDN